MSDDEQTAALAARAATGDAAAFEELLSPVLNPAFRLAMTMLKDRAAAEDAVQEAAFKAWRNVHRLRAGAPLRPWFLAITANECRTVRRSRWWQVLRMPEVGSDRYVDPEEAQAERMDLDVALDGLPRRQLLPLALYYHLDLPIEEVARILGCSPGAAKLRIHRALRALRPVLRVEALS